MPTSQFNEFIEYMLNHSHRTFRVVELAERYKVSRKTIYSWVRKARDLNITLDKERGWLQAPSSDRAPHMKQLTLTSTEIHVLLSVLAERMPDSPAIQTLIQKLKASQGVTAKSELSSTPPIFYPRQDHLRPGLFDDVIKACLERKVMQISYRNSKGQLNTYLFNPYITVPLNNHWYLCGVSHQSLALGHQTLLYLRMDMIESWTRKTDITHFEDPHIDWHQHFEDTGFGFLFSGDHPPEHIRIWVSPEKAFTIKRTHRHSSQHTQTCSNGSLIYTLCVPITRDLIAWIVGYGGHMQVLSPKTLRERVMSHAYAVLHQYEQSSKDCIGRSQSG